MQKFFLYIWQLPQNILGVILRLFYQPLRGSLDGNAYYYSRRFSGGISLGGTIIVGTLDKTTIRHELGHQKQSLMLGWLYLPIIGLPSLIWACLYGTRLIPYEHNGYYKFYTERWADKLAGIIRK